jgi:MFS family permease
VTQRKPPGISWESFVDQQIREGMARGEFDDLDGEGRPLTSLDRPHDELWWVKAKLEREEVSFLPPTLQLRKDVDDAKALVLTAPDEMAVRSIIEEVNARILHVNRYGAEGPPSNLMPLDVDAQVARWRDANPVVDDPPGAPTTAAAVVPSGRFPGWRVVLGVALVLFASAGLGFYGLAVYLEAITSELGFSTSAVSGATATFFVVIGVVGLGIARLIATVDVRKVMIGSSLVAAVGVVLIGRVTEVWHVYASYALFAAGVAGVNLIPATTVITRWFRAKRSVALAWSSTGLSVGGLVITPIASRLIDDLGLQTASLWLALVFPLVVIPACLFLVLPDPAGAGWEPDGERATSTHTDPGGIAFDVAVRTRHWWSITIGFLLVLGSQVAGINHLVKLGSERLDRGTGALALSVLTIGSVVGRLLGGMLAAKVRLLTMATVLVLVQASSFVLLSQVSSSWALVATALLFGITIGNVLMLRPLMIADSFGVRDYPRISARTDLVSTIGVAGGPFLMGALHDAFGYDTGYLVVAALTVVGVAVLRSGGPAPAQSE